MSEYLFLYRGPSASSASPEQMQQIMQKWLAWFKDLGEKGHIKNPGHPLERAGKVGEGRRNRCMTARSSRRRTWSAGTR